MARQLLLFCLLFSPFLAIAESSIDREAALLFESVMSPYCPGRTLSACPSDDARRLRDELRAELEAGKSPVVLKEELLGRFQNLAGKPSGTKAATLAMVGLGVFFAIGIFVIMRVVKPGENANVEEES